MKKNRRYVIFIMFLIVVITIILYTSKSKYVLKSSSLHAENSKEFYFNSSVLNEEEKTIYYNNWDGESEYTIKIDLANFEDVLRNTSLDIYYTVQATTENSNVTIQTNKQSENKIDGNANTTDEIEVKIIPNGGAKIDEIEVEVEVISTKPYKKTLKGKFVVANQIQKEYEVNIDNSNENYAKLLILTYNYEGTLRINYNEQKCFPELKSSLYTGATKGQGYMEIDVKKNRNYEIYFVKKAADNLGITVVNT